ncbi:hypothetical protein PGT21_030760 [Puccinia graminis f. sp. tritici]|uniref:Uncharacterized protein n=1 Tax=Puccinia graminis f. sp. tritici TaxID=56615 RepID=A0A5B0Q845_PUCGR|nr:hypothetical protein PGT21_030760 [Puccinia graminis f. sp. tritici]KAA1109242.1 hypothetical protein PGTUg99_022578 [Puccinia graminis f. sp. tritici]
MPCCGESEACNPPGYNKLDGRTDKLEYIPLLFAPSSSYQLPTFQLRRPATFSSPTPFGSPLEFQSTSLAALQSPPTSTKASFGSALGFFIFLPRVFPAYFSAGLHPVTFSPRL